MMNWKIFNFVIDHRRTTILSRVIILLYVFYTTLKEDSFTWESSLYHPRVDGVAAQVYLQENHH